MLFKFLLLGLLITGVLSILEFLKIFQSGLAVEILFIFNTELLQSINILGIVNLKYSSNTGTDILFSVILN